MRVTHFKLSTYVLMYNFVSMSLFSFIRQKGAFTCTIDIQFGFVFEARSLLNIKYTKQELRWWQNALVFLLLNIDFRR